MIQVNLMKCDLPTWLEVAENRVQIWQAQTDTDLPNSRLNSISVGWGGGGGGKEAYLIERKDHAPPEIRRGGGTYVNVPPPPSRRTKVNLIPNKCNNIVAFRYSTYSQ